MNNKRFTELTELESCPVPQLLDALIHEGTETVHTVGLLAEELHNLSQDSEPVDKDDLKQLAGFILEELVALRQMLEASVINRAKERFSHEQDNQIFVIQQQDNVGVYIGSPLTAPTEIITSGHRAGHKIMVQPSIQAGQLVALDAISAGAAIVKYGLSVGTAIEAITAGSHLTDALIKKG